MVKENEMKILFDHQIFILQKYGGISRYFYELMIRLDEMNGVNVNTSLIFSNNHYLSNRKKFYFSKVLPYVDFRGKVIAKWVFNKLNSTLKLKQGKFDIFHPTYYSPYFLDHLKGKPYVLTVHDMIHEKFPQLSGEKKIPFYKKSVIEKAAKIIAVSDSTKSDLIEIYGIDDNKIEVIHLGNSMVFGKAETTLELPSKYVLFVGRRGGYKNYSGFIESMAGLLIKDRELSVVCVGGGKFQRAEIEQLVKLDIRKQVFQYNVDDETLATLYKHALLFVFPSWYEGFGIPILEAFACNCPLACSDCSSFLEVAGQAGEYFNPYERESMTAVIKKTIYDESKRMVMIEAGRKRLAHFSWKKTAEETKRVYQSLL